MNDFCLTAEGRRSSKPAAIGLLLCGLMAAGAASAAPSPALLRKLAAPASARWSGAPLAPSLQRLGETFGVTLWIDRRVDPGAPLTLSVGGARFADVLDRVASEQRLGVVAIGRTVYLGPPPAAAALNELIDAGRAQRAPTMRRRGVTAWPRLTAPRTIAERLAREASVRLANAEAIPHDLWPAGQTAPSPAGDRLTLLLVGFDLRWRVDPSDAKRLVIEPIEKGASGAEPAPTLAALLKGGGEPSGPTRRVYTLRLVGQPLGAVLEQLAGQVGREVRFDPRLSDATQRSVRVAVEGASLEELLAAIGEAAGVAIKDDGSGWVVTPPRAPDD